MKAELNNYRQSPRKVRLVADLIKGKQVDQALTILDWTVKNASSPLKKLVRSAISNAKHNHQFDKADLFVEDIQVNPGKVLKRSRPGYRGIARPIKKRTSKVTVILTQKK